jgi:hypothetical protein
MTIVRRSAGKIFGGEYDNPEFPAQNRPIVKTQASILSGFQKITFQVLRVSASPPSTIYAGASPAFHLVDMKCGLLPMDSPQSGASAQD